MSFPHRRGHSARKRRLRKTEILPEGRPYRPPGDLGARHRQPPPRRIRDIGARLETPLAARKPIIRPPWSTGVPLMPSVILRGLTRTIYCLSSTSPNRQSPHQKAPSRAAGIEQVHLQRLRGHFKRHLFTVNRGIERTNRIPKELSSIVDPTLDMNVIEKGVVIQDSRGQFAGGRQLLRHRPYKKHTAACIQRSGVILV